MRRLIVVVIVASAATLFPASAASARGDGWEFLPASDFTTSACGTQILESVVANGEYAKFAVDPLRSR